MKAQATLAALISLALVLPAFAQNPDTIETEGQRPKEAAQRQKKAVESSEESSKFSVPGEDVTYEQVMANPDDVELNYRYALTQIKRGDLKASSATLERILLVNPSLLKVRLLYAVVMLRLDNLVESERELNTVLASNPPDNIKTEAQTYLKEVKKKQKRTQLSGRLSAGMEYDTNRNSNPASDKRLFGGTEVQLSGTNERRDDVSQVYMANVEAHHDLGTQAGHEVFATFNYYRTEEAILKILNLTDYSFAAGGVYKSHWGQITPSALFDHISLHERTFLRNHGADIRFDHKVDKQLSTWAEFRDVMQQYSPTDIVAIAGDRTGIQWDAMAGADYFFTPTVRGGIALDHSIKHAAQHYYAFERDGVTVNLLKLLGKGSFMMASANANYDQYDEVDLTLSPNYRRDQTFRFDATYGTPLTGLNKHLKDFMFTLTYEYFTALSTVENYAYTNNKVMGLVTYKWDLGL
jgi:hypothetical protein